MDTDFIKREFLAENLTSDRHVSVIDAIINQGGDDLVVFLIGQLKNENRSQRNAAAYCLRELRDPRAVEPLWDSILHPIDIKSTGSLVYALENFDCSHRLVDIFRILFYRNFESKMHASTILSDQTFKFSRDDLDEIRRMWDECLKNPSLCPAFDDSKENIQNNVDGFLAYLNDEQS